MLSLLAILPFLASVSVQATTYPRIESWQGSGFLDGFNYPTETYDNTTNGDVFWATAANTSLIYVNSEERVVMKVDNVSSVVYNEKRYAPKLYSKSLYEIGTVWVFDAVHLPYGCSVWPAFWTRGANWPIGGEIDIMEGVNLQTTDQVALHTEGTCTATSSSQTGNTTLTDCKVSDNSEGCTINATSANSYGAGFASAGGGVYVAEFAADAIRVWFFTRSSVPSSMTVDATSIDTSTLGTPLAEYVSSSCNITSEFSAQELVLDITLCGDWAGTASVLEETCPTLTGTNTCYTTYVINDGSTTYANAYFEINYLNVYSSSSSSNSSSSTTTVSAGVSAATSSSKSAAVSQYASNWGTVGWAAMGALAMLGVGMVL